MQRVVRALWPLAIWMAVVFTASTEIGSEANTSRILVPLLRWLDPHISGDGLQLAHLIVRKTAHVTEYAILAVLILRAVRVLRPPAGAKWSWALAGWAFTMAAAYAGTDELHQMLVPDRGPSIHDVGFDCAGAALGLLLMYAVRRREPTVAPGSA